MSDQIEDTNQERKWRGDMCANGLSTKHYSTELRATPTRLVLKGPLGQYFELSVEQVDHIDLCKFNLGFMSGLLTGIIQIHHTIAQIPEELLFSAGGVHANELLKELKELGYNVP